MKPSHRSGGDQGETLLELIVAIAILGVCTVAFGTSIALGAQVSDRHRQQADATAYVRNYAELIDSYVAAGNYSPCAGANAYAPDLVGLDMASDFTASQSAALGYTYNAAVGAVGPSGTWGPCIADSGIQQVTLTVSSARASEELVIVVRKP
jgi:prepilin-type N-terminal cleavage/methylation domain-containing protein